MANGPPAACKHPHYEPDQGRGDIGDVGDADRAERLSDDVRDAQAASQLNDVSASPAEQKALLRATEKDVEAGEHDYTQVTLGPLTKVGWLEGEYPKPQNFQTLCVAFALTSVILVAAGLAFILIQTPWPDPARDLVSLQRNLDLHYHQHGPVWSSRRNLTSAEDGASCTFHVLLANSSVHASLRSNGGQQAWLWQAGSPVTVVSNSSSHGVSAHVLGEPIHALPSVSVDAGVWVSVHVTPPAADFALVSVVAMNCELMGEIRTENHSEEFHCGHIVQPM